jgi:excisionase family DNA binding protein
MGKLLTVNEVAEELTVSRNTVYRWIEQKRIGAIKLSERSYRIPQDALDRFLATRISVEEVDTGKEGAHA